MRIIKTILVGMILAVAIIPLPGHTAATPPNPPQTTAPEQSAAPAPADAPPAETPAPAPAEPAPVTPAPAEPAPQPAATPVSNPPAAPAAAPAAAPEVKPVEVVKNGEPKLKLNFQDAPLQTVLEYLSETVGLTIVSGEPIASTRITVISRQPVTLDHAMEVINSMLKEKGLTAVIQGKNLKIVSLQNAPKEAMIKVRTGSDPNLCQPSDTVETWIIPVSHVTAMALVQNLQSLLPEYANLTANADGNALIITDTTASIRRLMQIVKALDTHMATVAEIRVFHLRNADATSTATLVNTIFQQQAQGGSRGGFGGRGGLGGVNPFQMMMQMRGGGGPGGMGGRGGQGGRGGSQGGGSQQGGGNINVQVVAAADTQTNSVVVRGPAESLALVESVIEALDNIGSKVAMVRVYQLRYADAINTADVINQLFNQQSSSSSRSRSGRGGGGGGFPGGPGPIAFRGPFGQGGPPGVTQGEAAQSAVQVTAAADSRTNTVVVTGPEAVLSVVDEVIKKLDSPLANVADVKVFHLEYADASNTAQLINEVFGQTGTTSSRSRSSRSSSQQMQAITFRGGPGGGFGMMGGQGGQAGTSSADIGVVASADTRTNSVVVSGPQETLSVIAQIIKDLDENPAAERRIFVYALKNGTASSLMTILNNLFQQMQTLNQRATGTRSTTTGGARNAGGGGAAGGGMAAGGLGAAAASTSSSNDSLSEETYFQADPNTNSLLCMTSSKNYEKIKPIIAELDKPVGQVLIKVLFAELTHTNDVDWGVEFSMLNLNKNGGVLSTQVFGQPLTLTTPSPGPSTGPLLGPGIIAPEGLSIRALQGDLDITLHALQETGKLNVLSRPYVLTRNNRMATITVADEVPIPTGSTTVAGQTQVTFDYRNDIGIVLDVTPSINEDGLVNMIVSPKITTQKGKVQISEGLEAEEFSTRSASTRVAVHDAQTIVIGGLIQDQTNNTIRKVPVLGDIPLVGNLFKRTIVSKAKTELLIFLTPYVAKEPKDLTELSSAEEQRSTFKTDKEAAELYRRHMNAMRSETEPNQP
jgi:general secretion pathway protein D